MGRRTYRLLRETDTIKKGALVQEMCDYGDQNYKLLDNSNHKFNFSGSVEWRRPNIEDNPKWWEEVFPLVPEYGTKAELEAFRKFSRKGK